MVFTDVTMPGTLNGFHLARLIRREYPHIAVLVSSGALPKGFRGEAPEARFIPKPYRMTEVVQIIRGMMNDSPSLRNAGPSQGERG